jgi:PAS domain S-box-containing protein
MLTSEPARILYVEDDFGAARLLQRYLDRAGYAVDLARDGMEGLAMWVEGSYDLLATDHDMPGMTGLDLIRTLTSRGPLPPTIMITGMGNEFVAVEAMKLGADDYIIKDTEAGYLKIVPLRVAQALKKRHLIDQARQAEERLAWESNVNAALAELYVPILSPSSSITDISMVVLEKAQVVTESAVGYVGEIDAVSGDLLVHTFTKLVETGMCEVDASRQVTSHGNADGTFSKLLGLALNAKDGFFVNAPEIDRLTGGLPAGHVPVTRFLSVPVEIENNLVGQIAVANAERDYGEADLEALRRFGDYYALGIQRKRDEASLRHAQEELEARVYKRTADLAAANRRLEDEIRRRETIERELVNSKDVVEALLDATNESVFLTDSEGRVLALNRTTALRLGLESESVLGKSVFDFFPPDVAAERISVFRQVLASGKPARVEGEEFGRIVSSTFYPVVDADGRVERVAVLGIDVTEMKRATEALQRAGEELESTVRERTAELSRINERLVEEIARRERTERTLRELTEALRGRVKELDCLYGISSLLTDSDVSSYEVFQRIVERIPRGWGHSGTVSARLVLGDLEFATADYRDCLYRQVADIVADGEKLGRVEVGFVERADRSDDDLFLEEETRLLREIADRLSTVVHNRRMQQAVNESEQTLSAILELVPVGIGLVENRSLVWLNKAYREMLGFEKDDDFAGQDTRFLYYSDDEYYAALNLYEKLRDGNAHELDLLFRRINGSPFAGRLTMKAFDPSNPLKRVVCSLMPLYRRA